MDLGASRFTDKSSIRDDEVKDYSIRRRFSEFISRIPDEGSCEQSHNEIVIPREMKNMSRARVIREISKPNAVPRVRARECVLQDLRLQ